MSAHGATRGAAHARQVDVPARDEEDATTGHAPDRLTLRDPSGVTQATGAGCSSVTVSMAARIRATDSASGVTDVSITRSGCRGTS